MTDHVPAYVAEFVELRRRYTEAKDAADAFAEAEIKAEYARRRAEDKAAGRDTSGRSVAMRRLRAYDTVMMRARRPRALRGRPRDRGRLPRGRDRQADRLMSRRKGMHTGASLDYLRSQRRIDARNAGYRSVGRGHTGDEPQYLRWQQATAAEFQQGREDAIRDQAESAS